MNLSTLTCDSDNIEVSLPRVEYRKEQWLFDEENHQLIHPTNPLLQESLNVFATAYYKRKIKRK